MATQIPVTPRAYTLRLRGADPQDQSWREALWRTHEAVNKGAKAFGDWLLTLRGGLCHTLADAKIPQGKGKPDREPTDDERKARRILLALSWLSVESERGAPDTQIVPHDLDRQSGARSNWRTVDALKEILKKRGLGDTEIQEWETGCKDSLRARIRDDAVWVNRSKAFDEAVMSIGSSLTREEVWDMLERFFGSRDAYLAPAKGSEDESPETGQEDRPKDLVQKAGQWLSSRFGTGKGADFNRMATVYRRIAEWADEVQSGLAGDKAIADLASALRTFDPASDDLEGVLGLISGPGYKSATRNLLNQLATKASVTEEDFQSLQAKATDDEQKCRGNTGSKGQRPYSDAILQNVESACAFTYLQDRGSARHSEFAVMLDHAARRVSLAHTWIKRAEAERRRFEVDGRKIDNVPPLVKAWLDTFCLERSSVSGALEPYRIRLRAVDGWKEVVTAWSRKLCITSEDRIASVRALQDDPEIKKFGDIQLFEALADDDALCVWHTDGETAKAPDPQPLIDYVLATTADFKKRQFKVPAYRHPDALLHPVFCDFGESRWAITFAIHEARDGFCEAKKNVERRTNAVQKAERAVKKADGNRQKEAKARAELSKTQADLAEAETRLAWLSNMHALSMKLWNGRTVRPAPSLRWQSKRLIHDLALKDNKGSGSAPQVTRADRLGRAAGDAPGHGAVRIASIFEQQHWNGRLQAPRTQLDAIGVRVAERGWDAKAKQMRDRLRWLITFSANLQPSGPWVEYAADIPDNGLAKPFVSRKGDYAVRHQGNDAREGQAKLVLSRLPGLRVLSVDLGHRYAAACAVWETVDVEQAKRACHAAGHTEPKEADLYLHLKRKVAKEKKGSQLVVEETTIYRRIGADTLPGGTLHPAPWARLDRQFLIKLQGEDREARKASPAEIGAAEELAKAVGREPLDRRSLRVDHLMSEAVRTVRLALQRHARRARIAFNLTAQKKLLPGAREEALTNDGRITLLADTLADWCALFTGREWTDEWTKQQWETRIAPLLQGAALPQPPEDADATPKARKEYRADLTENLKPVAEGLAQNGSLCHKLHCLWATRWRENDVVLRKRLRWLRDWILPRGKKLKADRAIRHVGGLSLTRIATVKSLYQVQKAFHMRAEPDDLRKNIPSKGDGALVAFGRSILDVMERMREQRVKQLASRIAEAALGIGRTKRSRGGRDPKRPRQHVDEPCHAVVIENLTYYRPAETRTRRENRQLMSWSSSKVKKYLAEACQLNGLHLREVQAGYTSRQDSRTGAPGVRCQDVLVKEFMRSPFWRKQVAQAEGEGGERERFLCDLNAKWKNEPEANWQMAGNVRIPLKGGEIFVSADPNSPAAKGLQADLNAAGNIGLKALTDPDWPGNWWYIPAALDSEGWRVPKAKSCSGAACLMDWRVAGFKNGIYSRGGTPLAIGDDESVRHAEEAAAEAKEAWETAKKHTKAARKGRDKVGLAGADAREKEAKSVYDLAKKNLSQAKKAATAKECINLWRDVRSASLSQGEWCEWSVYWPSVEQSVVSILRHSAGLATHQGDR